MRMRMCMRPRGVNFKKRMYSKRKLFDHETDAIEKIYQQSD